MAGVTGHTRFSNVRLPACVDLVRHLQHLARNHLGVHTVVCKITSNVAVVATLLGCYPRCDGTHGASEFAHTQITQYLHVLVNRARFGPTGHLDNGIGNGRCNIDRSLRGQGTGVVHLLHGRTTKACLRHRYGWPFAACH